MAHTKLYKFKGDEGYESVINENNSTCKHIGFDRLLLSEGKNIEISPVGKEVVLVLQSGDFTASLEWKGNIFIKECSGKRSNVFDDLPTALYIPPQGKAFISTAGGAEFRVFSAVCEEGNSPYFCPPEEVKEGEPGTYIYKRKYRFIFGPPGKHNDTMTKNLIVGESVSVPGGWIGFPGHRHDYDTDSEYPLEEIFSYRVKGPKGVSAIQYSFDLADSKRLWDEFHVVDEDDTAIALPVGYHTTQALPGSVVYLLWGLAGEKKIYKMAFDPRFTWLEDALY